MLRGEDLGDEEPTLSPRREVQLAGSPPEVAHLPSDRSSRLEEELAQLVVARDEGRFLLGAEAEAALRPHVVGQVVDREHDPRGGWKGHVELEATVLIRDRLRGSDVPLEGGVIDPVVRHAPELDQYSGQS